MFLMCFLILHFSEAHLSAYIICIFQTYCRSLGFEAEPNVDLTKKLFDDLYVARGYNVSEVTYLILIAFFAYVVISPRFMTNLATFSFF